MNKRYAAVLERSGGKGTIVNSHATEREAEQDVKNLIYGMKRHYPECSLRKEYNPLAYVLLVHGEKVARSYLRIFNVV